MSVSRRDLFAAGAAVAAASIVPRAGSALERTRMGIVGMVKPVRRPGTLEEVNVTGVCLWT